MLKFSDYPLDSSTWQRRVVVLSLATSPLLGAYFFNSTGFVSPFPCLLRSLTGIPCPGCGLTRSFLAIVRGDLAASLSYHVLGPLLFAILTLATLHLGLEVITRRHLQGLGWSIFSNKKLQLLALLFILGYHSTRLIALSQSGELGLDFWRSPLGQWFLSSEPGPR